VLNKVKNNNNNHNKQKHKKSLAENNLQGFLLCNLYLFHRPFIDNKKTAYAVF